MCFRFMHNINNVMNRWTLRLFMSMFCRHSEESFHFQLDFSVFLRLPLPLRLRRWLLSRSLFVSLAHRASFILICRIISFYNATMRCFSRFLSSRYFVGFQSINRQPGNKMAIFAFGTAFQWRKVIEHHFPCFIFHRFFSFHLSPSLAPPRAFFTLTVFLRRRKLIVE